MNIRWFKNNNGVVTLQQHDVWQGGWTNVPTITEHEYKQELLQEAKEQQIENDRIMEALKGKGYTVR